MIKLLSNLKSASSNPPKFKVSRSRKKKKFRTTIIVLFGYFWTGVWKHYCHIWNHVIEKKLWSELPYLIIFGLEFEKAIFIFVWNYYYRVSQNVKVHERQKSLSFGPKITIFVVLLGPILKELLSYLNWPPSKLSKCKVSC